MFVLLVSFLAALPPSAHTPLPRVLAGQCQRALAFIGVRTRISPVWSWPWRGRIWFFSVLQSGAGL